jgi:hypothetical protein
MDKTLSQKSGNSTFRTPFKKIYPPEAYNAVPASCGVQSTEESSKVIW